MVTRTRGAAYPSRGDLSRRIRIMKIDPELPQGRTPVGDDAFDHRPRFGDDGAADAGRRGLMMPAFSRAIRARWSPSCRVWSKLMLVMSDTIG